MSLRYLTTNQLSEITGRDRRTIKSKLAHLKVQKSEGRSQFYDANEALSCLYLGDQTQDSDDLDLDVERAKLVQLQARKAQLQIEELEGLLIPIEKTLEAVGTEYTRVRSRLLSISSKLAMPCANEINPALVKELIDREISEALEELTADTNLEASLPDDSIDSEIAGVTEDDSEAADETEPGRMG